MKKGEACVCGHDAITHGGGLGPCHYTEIRLKPGWTSVRDKVNETFVCDCQAFAGRDYTDATYRTYVGVLQQTLFDVTEQLHLAFIGRRNGLHNGTIHTCTSNWCTSVRNVLPEEMAYENAAGSP